MPEGYDGTNIGSFTFAELTGILFPQVTDSYFHSLAVEDLWSPVGIQETIYTGVNTEESIFTPLTVTTSVFTPA
tara:strand:- start:137 stop:358 length:222 start_codon:yes stop_codon:yes gene_type:complete